MDRGHRTGKEHTRLSSMDAFHGKGAEGAAIPKREGVDGLERMSKKELINEVLKARIVAERAKKDTRRKGGGRKKEFRPISDANKK